MPEGIPSNEPYGAKPAKWDYIRPVPLDFRHANQAAWSIMAGLAVKFCFAWNEL